MIQYRKSDGSLGEFNSDKLYSIKVKENTFTITLKNYGYDEYEYCYEEITDIIEIRI